MTTSEPFRSLVEEARKLEREGIAGHEEKIMAATIFVGCAWTDSPDTGMSVMVTADGSRDAARAAAVYLARKVWDARREFTFGCETAELEEARPRWRRRNDCLPDRQRRQCHGEHAGDLPIVLRHLVLRESRTPSSRASMTQEQRGNASKQAREDLASFHRGHRGEAARAAVAGGNTGCAISQDSAWPSSASVMWT
jgi:microcystin degradation protein MlrC